MLPRSLPARHLERTARWQQALQACVSDPSTLIEALGSRPCCANYGIDHVRRVRIRTRLPVVLPERIDDGFLEAWSPRLRVQRAMVVLLAGVNDSVEALADLSEALVGHGVLPYCLHVLDPVRGAAHFDVPELVVRRLVAERLPGYRVPRLVRQVPGATGKTMLPPASR